MRNFYSPLRYPGGKNRIFNFVASIMAENNLIGKHYVEPFAGGAGLALRLLYEEYANSITINDIDPLVYSFWTACIDENARLINWIQEVSLNINEWHKHRAIARAPDNHDIFTLATTFLFLNRTNVSGIINGGVIGGIKQNRKYKLDARFNQATLIERIKKIGRYATRIEVTQVDGKSLVEKYHLNNQEIFMYLDPPYFEKGSHLYLNAYKTDDHLNLASAVKEATFPWILSYDCADFIVNLYDEFDKVSYSLQHATSNSIGNELMVFPPHIEHKVSLQFLKDPKHL